MPKKQVKISEIATDMGFTLEAEVVDVGEPCDIETRRGLTKITQAKLKDGSGEIAFSLWGDRSQGLSVGDRVKITNGYTRSFGGQLQVNVGRYGRIEKLAA